MSEYLKSKIQDSISSHVFQRDALAFLVHEESGV